MPKRWESQAFLDVYEDLVKQMDPSSTRIKCFAYKLITSAQRDKLSHLHGAEHNTSLLSLLEKLNDDQYDDFCQVLSKNDIKLHDDSVAKMREAPLAAAVSASAHSKAATSSVTKQREAAAASGCTHTKAATSSATDQVQGGSGRGEKDRSVTEAEQRTLRSLLSLFMKTVKPEALCDDLHSDGIITDGLWVDLAGESKTQQERARLLYQAVKGGGDTAFERLIAALEKSDLLPHQELADKLREKLKEVLAET